MSNSVTTTRPARPTKRKKRRGQEDVLGHRGGTSPAPSPPSTPSRDPAAEASGLEDAASRIRARYSQGARHLLPNADDVPQIFLQPTADDPGLWAVPVKDRVSAAGTLPTRNSRWAVGPLHLWPVCRGRWSGARDARRGYPGGCRPTPSHPSPVPPGTGTRTKGRPDPRLWGYSELLSVFGERKVKHGPGAQGEEHIPYKFSRDTFECGLVLKVLSSEHLELAAALPDLLLPFSKHPGILHDPAFARALAQVTQATYQREDRVEVTSGEYTGAVGAITIALGGRASIAATLPGCTGTAH
ncbi:hypothetical protein BC834DRAFT_848362 [Gloeopeniophorella convolvens]|nr:hypothetical protein BC834DRAFT_848362 [Gloeopeniophorella convolvens]